MSQVLFSLDAKTSLEDAAQFFASHKLTTAPIVGEGDDIIGVLTDFQLLRMLLRSRQEGKKGVSLGEVRDDLDPVVTIHEEDSIVSAFRLMIQSPNHRIYAIHGGKLTGALSPKDLLRYLSGAKSAENSELDSIMHKQIETILKELNDTRRMLSDYQSMFLDAPYLMHSVDMQGKIVQANRMAHYILGYDDGELVGKSIRAIYPPENHKKALEGLETVKTLGFHPLVSAVMVKKDGDYIRIDIASTLKKNDKGQPEATITVGRLSDSHRMLNYLQKAAYLLNRRPKAAAGASK